MLTTQISGKFSVEDGDLFKLKDRLTSIGINVAFPASNKIIGVWKKIPVTFDTSKTSFYDVEQKFFESIRNCSFHFMHNKHIRSFGYIGESAAIETAYALIIGKPVIIIYEPVYGDKVNPEVKTFLTYYRSLMKVVDAQLDDMQFLNAIQSVYKKIEPIKFTLEEQEMIYKNVELLLNSYLTY